MVPHSPRRLENLKSTGPQGPWGFESLALRHSNQQVVRQGSSRRQRVKAEIVLELSLNSVCLAAQVQLRLRPCARQPSFALKRASCSMTFSRVIDLGTI